MNGVLVVDKERDYSSHDVVQKVRSLMHTKKVGHCGTLDPFATGVLLITIGEATKISRFLEAHDKVYLATLRLGIQTDTMDETGTVIEEKPVPKLETKQIEELLASFLGEQEQIPPMYSAIKINGKKLYELARVGIEVDRSPRHITIYDIKLVRYEGDIIEFRVQCSKGTYIRTLGSDIAAKLNTLGHLTSLRRERIGALSLDVSMKVGEVNPKTPLISIVDALYDLRKVDLTPEQCVDVSHGKPLALPYSDPVVLLCDGTKPLALYELHTPPIYRCLRGITYEETD